VKKHQDLAGISAFQKHKHLPYLKPFGQTPKTLNKIENSTTKYTTNHVAIMTNIEREKEKERERRLWKKKLIRVQ